MSRVGRLRAVIVGLCMAGPLTLGAQELPEDAATLARLAKRYPCPPTMPHAWVADDPTLGTGPRCSLVAAAAAAIRSAPRDAGLAGFDPDRVGCVRIAAFAFRDLYTNQVNDAY